MGVQRRLTRRAAGFEHLRTHSSVELVGPTNELAFEVARAIEKHGRLATRTGRSSRASISRRRAAAKGVGWLRRSEPRGSDVDQESPPTAIVVNGLDLPGETAPATLRNQILRIREYEPNAPVVVLLDETNARAVTAARKAGATDFFGTAAAKNPAALEWRISVLFERSAAMRQDDRTPSPRPVLGLMVGDATAPTPAEVEKALARVEAGLKRRPGAKQALARASELDHIATPELRDEDSGRLDARRIADRLGVSVNRLAPAAGVSQQALSKRPDSPRAQKRLAEIARVLGLLHEVGLDDEAKVWLNTAHPRLGGEPPLELILAGRAGEVARMLERAVEGIPE
jgi:Protein of unknown function (DUF2384)